jgi:hypothetical protein
MRFVAGTVLVLIVSASSAPGQRVLDENPFYLRSDERLQVRLNVDAEHPKLAQIVAKLRDATKLELVVDETLNNHDPDFGHIQPSKSGYFAWQLMEMVAKKDLQRGYWEKTSGGYRLRGGFVVPPSPRPKEAPEQQSALSSALIISLGVLVASLFALLLARRMKRQLQTVTSEGHGPVGPISRG